jgi:hypothetical protein
MLFAATGLVMALAGVGCIDTPDAAELDELEPIDLGYRGGEPQLAHAIGHPSDDGADGGTNSFTGAFADVASDGPDCDSVFATVEYDTRHFIIGPTGRTVVSHFLGEEGEGFFAGLTFVSNLGYNDDFLYRELVHVAGIAYEVEIYGLLADELVYMEAVVTRLGDEGAPVCSASAAYTGLSGGPAPR